jgi:hypothetical protein
MLNRKQFAFAFVAVATWTTTASAPGQTARSLPPALPMIQVTDRHPVTHPHFPAESPSAPALKFVQYQGGRLSIFADGATLKDVLEVVGPMIGANIQVPPETSADRVALRLGPASPAEVLRALFTGSAYDYVMLGSPEQPDAVKTVIVRLRTVTAEPQPAISSSLAASPASSPSFPVPDAMPLAADLYEQYRMPNGMTPSEAGMSRADFLERFQALEKMRKLQEEAQKQ